MSSLSRATRTTLLLIFSLTFLCAATSAFQLPAEIDEIIASIGKQMNAIQDLPPFMSDSNKKGSTLLSPSKDSHDDALKHTKHSKLLSKVLSLVHVYNYHPKELSEFISKNFHEQVQLMNSVWETHRYLEGHRQIEALFLKLWKRDENAMLIVSDLAQQGNRVAAIIGIDFTDPVTERRVRTEGQAMFYFDDKEQFHRIYLCYDHHRVELHKGRTSVENPIVKSIFEKEPGTGEGHIGHKEPYSRLSDLTLRLVDHWNNRDLKTLNYYHGTQFTKDTKLYSSSFGSDRHLEDFARIKLFFIGADYMRANNTMILVNDVMHYGNDVVLRVTGMTPVEHKGNPYFKGKENDIDPESTCKIRGVSCMKVEGMMWLKYNNDGYIERMYMSHDSYRVLLKKGLLHDIEKDESLMDFEEAKKA